MVTLSVACVRLRLTDCVGLDSRLVVVRHGLRLGILRLGHFLFSFFGFCVLAFPIPSRFGFSPLSSLM